MVHTLDRVDTASGDADYPEEAEQSTNGLNSGNLRQPYIEQEEAHPESDLDAIDWVQTLTSVNPVTQQLTDEEPDPQPVSSGMGQHITGPARMVPAKRTFLPPRVKHALLTLLVILAVGGTVGAGIYALVDSGWLSTLFAAQGSSPAITAPIVAGQPGAQATPRSQPPPRQDPTVVPQQPVVPVVALKPDEIRDKAIEQYKLGNFEQAITLLEGVVSAGSNDARTYYHLGLAYLAASGRKHSLDDAELAFRTAVSLDPTWAASRSMLAESLVRRGFYAEAIPPALEATRLDPNSGDAWMTLSRAYKGAGQEADATRAYAEAARLAPAPPMQP